VARSIFRTPALKMMEGPCSYAHCLTLRRGPLPLFFPLFGQSTGGSPLPPGNFPRSFPFPPEKPLAFPTLLVWNRPSRYWRFPLSPFFPPSRRVTLACFPPWFRQLIQPFPFASPPDEKNEPFPPSPPLAPRLRPTAPFSWPLLLGKPPMVSPPLPQGQFPSQGVFPSLPLCNGSETSPLSREFRSVQSFFFFQ